jgi:hypothetical protein
MAKINLPAVQHKADFVTFSGGLDAVSPPFSIAPGFVRNALNYEEDINGGYASVTGYERYDGRPSPSSATYSSIPYTIASGSFTIGSSPVGSAAFYLGLAAAGITVGVAITGSTSGATAVVFGVDASSLTLTGIVGTFSASEIINGTAVTVYGPSVSNGASGLLDAISRNSAADALRANIQAVPGTGPVLGVWYYKGIVYAFRNTLTIGVGMYKSSAGGWVAVPLGIEVYFTAGTGTAPIEGATITKGAVSGVMTRLVLESGTFGAGTAAGRMIFASVTSGPFTAGAFTGGISATCVSQAAITIPNQGGRFEFGNYNFYAGANSVRMYGVDGANRGFEFDGTVFVPINTGMAVDHPQHLYEHCKHLFYSFFGSVQHSGIGTPYAWATILGAAELGCADTVTGFIGQPGNETSPALAIFCRNRTYMLYGTSVANWNLVQYNETNGAIAHSLQKIGQTFGFDDRGVTTMQQAKEFGNFLEATVSRRVNTLLQTKRTITTDSHVSHDKQQYRLFYSNGSATYFTVSPKQVSAMPLQFPDPVLCSVSDEIYGGGSEVFFFGSSNGFVYQMERGTSFDGYPIEAYIDLAFNNLKNYRMLNRYHRLSFEMMGSGYSEFGTSYGLGYESTDIAQPEYENHIVELSSPIWDAFTWDAFTWDGVPLTNLSISTPGNGENISVKIHSNSDYFTPIKFSGVFIEYHPLRRLR